MKFSCVFKKKIGNGESDTYVTKNIYYLSSQTYAVLDIHAAKLPTYVYIEYMKNHTCRVAYENYFHNKGFFFRV